MVRTAVGADHIEIESDATKPDGTPRKLLDLGRLNATGWRSHMKSEDGLASPVRTTPRNSTASAPAHSHKANAPHVRARTFLIGRSAALRTRPRYVRTERATKVVSRIARARARAIP